MSPGLLFPVILGSVSFYPVSWIHGQLKGKHFYRSVLFHLNGYHFWKRDIISGCSSIHVVKAKQDGKFQSFILICCPLTRLRPWCWGPWESSSTLGVPGSAVARWTAGPWRSRDAVRSLDTPWLAPTSKGLLFSSSVKLYFSYQKFGLIYIYTNIYINISIYTVILLN